MYRPSILRLLNYGIAITKKRPDMLSTTKLSTDPAPPNTHPFFAFLARYEDSLTEIILSFLDPFYCCKKDHNNLLKCWTSLGGDEDDLRRGYGDDMTKWEGVKVKGGRVVAVHWSGMGLKGTVPFDIMELTGLTKLYVQFNQVISLPAKIGHFTALINLCVNFIQLEALLPEIRNLTLLETLHVRYNNCSGAVPSSLANLT